MSSESTHGREQRSGFADKGTKGVNLLAFCPHLIGTASPPPRGHRGGSSVYLVGAEAAILMEACPKSSLFS